MKFDEYGRPVKTETSSIGGSIQFDEYGRPEKKLAVQISPAIEKAQTNVMQEVEDDVPVLGTIVGGLDGMGAMIMNFMGTGMASGAQAFGFVDKEFTEDVATDPILQPKTATGRMLQGWIGNALEWYHKNTEGFSDSLSLMHKAQNVMLFGEMPSPVEQGIVGSAAETTREAIPLILPGLLPYAPRYVSEKLKGNVQSGKVAPTVTERFTYIDFETIYKAEHPKARPEEVVGAWSEYSGGNVQEAYKILARTPAVNRKPAKEVVPAQDPAPVTRIPDKPMTLAEQVKEITDSPITLTRAEFAEGLKHSAYLKQAKTLKTKIKNLKSLTKELYDKKKIAIVEREIVSLQDKVKQLVNMSRTKETNNVIDAAYDKYVATRKLPKETVFDLREREATTLRAMQEEYAWQQLEKQTGSSRFVNTAQIISAPFEKVGEIKAAVTEGINKVPGSTVEVVRDPVDIMKDAKDLSDKMGPPRHRPKKVESGDSTPAHLTEMITKELEGIYKPGMSYEGFKSAITGKLYGMPDVVVQSLYNKINKPVKAQQTASSKNPAKALEFSTRNRSMLAATIENVLGGKSIGMLFGKLNKSPALKQLVAMIVRPEKHQLVPGEARAETPVILAQKQAHAVWALKIQGIYDRAQIALGGGNFVGPKNLVPSVVGGWGSKSLPTRVNDLLFDVLNGKTDGLTPVVSSIVKDLRQTLDEFHAYMKQSGVDLEYLPNYFPRMWISGKIRSNEAAFEQMLSKKGFTKGEIDNLRLSIIEHGGMIEIPVKDGAIRSKYLKSDARYSRKASNIENLRKLHNLTPTDVRPFVDTNVHKVLARYIEQGTRRAEFARKFGPDQKVLDQLVTKAQEELTKIGDPMTYQELERIYDLVDGLQGMYKLENITKYHDMLVRWPKSLANFAYLQTAALVSIPEILLPIYHGGIKAWVKTMPSAVNTAVREFARNNISKNISKSELQMFAEEIGKAGDVMAMEHVHAYHGGLSPTMLDQFTFQANLLHPWTKFVNYVAVGTFLNKTKSLAKTWGEGKKSTFEQSDVALYDYLGVPKQDLIEWYKGGSSPNSPVYQKMKTAAQIFAEDAVLTPNVANRPMWHQNPGFFTSMLSQLKTFPSMMGNTVMKRWALDFWYDVQQRKSVFPRNAVYMLGVSQAMVLTSMLVNEYTDYAKYGSGGNPRFNENADDPMHMYARASRTIGLGGITGTLLDSFQYAEISEMGYVGSLAGGPGFSIYNELFKMLGGISDWDASRTAQPMAVFGKALTMIYQKYGIGDEDALTKKEIKKWLEDIFVEYLGMNK